MKRPTPSVNEPKSEEVSVYALSKMISEKTKFRIVDVEEVVREVGNAIFKILADRKSVTLGGINIRSKWERLEYPKYVRDGDGYWVYGYYKPVIDMDNRYRLTYIGKTCEFKDSDLKQLSPYFDKNIDTQEDIAEYCKKTMSETSKDGRYVCIDEDGYLIYREDSKKKKKIKFNENFHPTWAEKQKYYFTKGALLREYKRKLDAGEPATYIDDVYVKLIEMGFDTFKDMEDEVLDGIEEDEE